MYFLKKIRKDSIQHHSWNSAGISRLNKRKRTIIQKENMKRIEILM